MIVSLISPSGVLVVVAVVVVAVAFAIVVVVGDVVVIQQPLNLVGNYLLHRPQLKSKAK